MKKIERAVMFCLALLPFAIIALFFIARIGQGSEQFSSFSQAFNLIAGYSDYWGFREISAPLMDLLTYFGNSTAISCMSIISNILSYEVVLFIIHIAVEVLMFLPKFCTKIFEKAGLKE